MERGAHISQVQQRQRTIALRVHGRRKGEPEGFAWAEGIWSLLKRSIANFAAATGLRIEAW